MATYTASELYGGMKMNHTGPNVSQSRLFAALSVSDVALLARVPNHATITRMYVSGGTTGITTGSWSLGFQTPVVNGFNGASLTTNSLHAAMSLTASAQVIFPFVGGTLFPIQISVSDDVAFVWVVASTLGSFTATTTSSLNCLIEYVVPGG